MSKFHRAFGNHKPARLPRSNASNRGKPRGGRFAPNIFSPVDDTHGSTLIDAPPAGRCAICLKKLGADESTFDEMRLTGLRGVLERWTYCRDCAPEKLNGGLV